MWLVAGILDSTGTRKYTFVYTLLLFYSFYVRGFFGVKFVYKTALDYVYSKNLKPCLQNYVHFHAVFWAVGILVLKAEGRMIGIW